MAVHILTGAFKSGFQVFNYNFGSVEVSTGNTYEFTNPLTNIARITAKIDSYVAFTDNGTTPDATTNPRAFIKAGTTLEVVIKKGVKITVLDA